MRKILALLVLGLLLLTGNTTASAHAQLLTANPTSKSTVYTLPAQVKLMFSDDLIAVEGGNQIQVTDPKGKRIETGEMLLVGNQLSIALKKSTLLGRYQVTYRVLSEDGHPVSSNYSFTLAKTPVIKKPAKTK